MKGFKMASIVTLVLALTLVTGVGSNTTIKSKAAERSPEIKTFTFDTDKRIVNVRFNAKDTEGIEMIRYKTGTSKDDLSFPTYKHDKIYYFNKEGKYVKTEEVTKGDYIFNDNTSTWLEAHKEVAGVSSSSDYIEYSAKNDGDICIAKSVDAPNGIYLSPNNDKDTIYEIEAAWVTKDGKIANSVKKTFMIESAVSQEPEVSIKKISENETERKIEVVIKAGTEKLSMIKLNNDVVKLDKNGGKVVFTLTDNDDYYISLIDEDGYEIYSKKYTVESLNGVSSEDDNLVTDTKSPSISIKGIPDKANKPIKITIRTNEIATISFNGRVKEGTKKAVFSVSGNGEYTVTAVDKSGNESSKVAKVGCFNTEVDAKWHFDMSDWGKIKNAKKINSSEIPHTGYSGYDLFIALGLIGLGGTLFFVAYRKKIQK